MYPWQELKSLQAIKTVANEPIGAAKSQSHPIQKCTREFRGLSAFVVIPGDCTPYTEVHPMRRFGERL